MHCTTCTRRESHVPPIASENITFGRSDEYIFRLGVEVDLSPSARRRSSLPVQPAEHDDRVGDQIRVVFAAHQVATLGADRHLSAISDHHFQTGDAEHAVTCNVTVLR